MNSLAFTLRSQGKPNSKLTLGFYLGVINTYIFQRIPETSTQNLTQLLSSVESLFATDIPRQWGAKVLVGLTLNPSRLTNLGLMITKSKP